MPAFRLVYVQDEIGRPETVTADFTSRADAVAALAARGLRVLHVAALRAGESASDPVVVSMTAEAEAPARSAAIGGHAAAGGQTGAGNLSTAGAR